MGGGRRIIAADIYDDLETYGWRKGLDDIFLEERLIDYILKNI